jgi:hypothetical protein
MGDEGGFNLRQLSLRDSGIYNCDRLKLAHCIRHAIKGIGDKFLSSTEL